jgi:hypothetical protein
MQPVISCCTPSSRAQHHPPSDHQAHHYTTAYWYCPALQVWSTQQHKQAAQIMAAAVLESSLVIGSSGLKLTKNVKPRMPVHAVGQAQPIKKLLAQTQDI